MVSQIINLPLEIGGIECARVRIAININESTFPALSAAGFGEMELANTLKEKAREIVVALDGSVPGLIVSSLEDL